MLLTCCALSMLLPLSTLYAAGSSPPARGLWQLWNWDPWVLMLVGGMSWLYGRGLFCLWRRAGVGRGIRRWQAACYGVGIVTLIVALISPLDYLAHLFFSMHMLQHMLLMMIAAPLLVLAKPHIAMVWALPPAWRYGLGRWWKNASFVRGGWRALTQPAFVWVVHIGAFWLWHVPVLYEGALQNQVLHALEHFSFFGTSLLFWWVLMQIGVRRRLGYGMALLFVFTTMIQGTILGALITFSPTVWYPTHASHPISFWGHTPLQDQQLAGLIMWIPSGPIYLFVFLRLIVKWLRASEQEAQRMEPVWAELVQQRVDMQQRVERG
jgi:putative membrane protein